jgi:hypothetical protein
VEEFGRLEAAEEAEVVDGVAGGLGVGGLYAPMGLPAPVQAIVGVGCDPARSQETTGGQL